MTDSFWAAQMVEVMTPEYFELKYLHYLADKYFDYFTRHRVFPTLPLLASVVRDDLRDDSDRLLKQQIVEYLQRIKFNPSMGDLAEVKERSIAFCRKQAMKEALVQCVDLIEQDKNDSVVEVMKSALAAGVPASVGHDFFEDFEARFSEQSRLPVPTGIEQLDRADVLAGGLAKGELGVVVANTGVGKCSVRDTYIDVRHEVLTINGVDYVPWQKINTKRGTIFVRDAREDDELV